jgi:hypothetical protein
MRGQQGRGGEGGASAQTHHVRADACARPRVNADVDGRQDDVRGRPDGHFHPKMSVMTSLSTTPPFASILFFYIV